MTKRTKRQTEVNRSIKQLLNLVAASLILSLPGFAAERASAATAKPNVLLILADDLGFADLGFQGSQDIKSPNLDKLAAESVRFTDGHTTASVCSPSRAGMMTGRYQQRFGHEANVPPYPKGMDTDETTMAQWLKKLGYRTGIIGKWHLGDTEQHYPTKRGFDYFYGLREGHRNYFFDPKKDLDPKNFRAIEEQGTPVKFDGYLTDVLGEQTIDFIERSKEQSPESPFFAFLSFTAPHGPLQATEEDLARFDHIQDKRRKTYAAMVWAMDRAIGKVLDHLDATGQADNTLVWFLSDNGGATNNSSINLPLAGHKGIKFEGGIRVPFLLRWKAAFAEGRVEDRMVSAMDILPTSVAAAGGDLESIRDPSQTLDGVNLLPFLNGTQNGVPHEKLYWHKLWFSAARDGNWKLIWVQDYGYALYDLKNDLSEKVNLANQLPDRVDAMANDLNQWKSQMVEPLWGEAQKWFRVHSKNHIRLIEGAN